MKAVVAAFNQEKALVGAFSVIVQLHQLIVYSTNSVVSGDQDTGTMTRAEPGKMFQWTLCARLLPDLVSSRSKYLMNLNKFSALENVSPLICARGGD